LIKKLQLPVSLLAIHCFSTALFKNCKTKLASVCLCCRSRRFKTANSKTLFTNSTHAS